MTDDEVRELAQEAGLGDRSIKKLIAANQKRRGEEPTGKSPRGHGAPREIKTRAPGF